MEFPVEARASDSNPQSRAFAWPVLESGSASFQNGVYRVWVEQEERGRSAWIRHEILGAPLIERWMREGRLIYAVGVAAPRSMYRKIHRSAEPKHLVEWRQRDLGDYPAFMPMIVAREEIIHDADCARDGLVGLWEGKRLRLPKAARVAVGTAFNFQSGIESLLQFREDSDLNAGTFKLETDTKGGFKFIVSLDPKLFRYLQHRRNEPSARNLPPWPPPRLLSLRQGVAWSRCCRSRFRRKCPLRAPSHG